MYQTTTSSSAHGPRGFVTSAWDAFSTAVPLTRTERRQIRQLNKLAPRSHTPIEQLPIRLVAANGGVLELRVR